MQFAAPARHAAPYSVILFLSSRRNRLMCVSRKSPPRAQVELLHGRPRPSSGVYYVFWVHDVLGSACVRPRASPFHFHSSQDVLENYRNETVTRVWLARHTHVVTLGSRDECGFCFFRRRHAVRLLRVPSAPCSRLLFPPHPVPVSGSHRVLSVLPPTRASPSCLTCSPATGFGS